MKQISVLALLLFAVSCSSPVEKYIKNDFARVVRENALDEEVHNEIDRVIALFEDLADKANPDAKQAKELKAKADKWEKEIYSRLNSYKRTGSYRYIINIANDADECDAMHARANSLAKKAKPYTSHKDKQIKRVVQCLSNVDALVLMNSADLIKNDSVTVEFIFNKVFGTPAKMANPSDTEIEELALAYMTNYFIENPNQTVLTYKFQKKEDRWYIQLSNETQYFLSAIKYGKGQYSYQYVQTDSPFLNSSSTSTTSSTRTNTKVSSGDVDKFLDKYENVVNNYVKVYSKAMAGDTSALSSYMDLLEDAEELAEELENIEDEMSISQMERYAKITAKLTEAALNAL